MASHHHHPTAASYCYCFPPYSPCHHPPPPSSSPPPQPDWHPLYHPPSQPHFYSAQTHLPNSHQRHPHFQERYFEEERGTQYTISSLLRRIATLESALRSRSSHSLRDTAARTIQTHFRAFLLHRSRTLRQLKDLASIKSTLTFLKSSVSKQTHFDYDVVYHHAMELVRKLDTIQGGDPMIRDGKSSVRKELNKILGFIDGLFINRAGFSSGVNVRYERGNVKNRVPNGEKKVGNVKCGRLRSVTMDKLRALVERIDKLAEELDEEEESEVIETSDVFIKKHCVSGNKNGVLLNQLCGVQSKVKKSVSFADKVKAYGVLRRNSEAILDDDDDDDDDSIDRVNEFEDDLCREVEEIGVASKDDDEYEAHSENGSDGEKDLRSCLRNGERKMYNEGEVDNISFSAPLPLKMETRADSIDKRKKLIS